MRDELRERMLQLREGCECGDRRALADALARLLARPELRATMGRAGRERVMRDFATAACIANLECIFRVDSHRDGAAA